MTRQFKQKDDYFCIKQIWSQLSGYRSGKEAEAAKTLIDFVKKDKNIQNYLIDAGYTFDMEAAKVLAGAVEYDYDILGLGTDDKVYKLTKKGWVEYDAH